jgi:hypothetical protein
MLDPLRSSVDPSAFRRPSAAGTTVPGKMAGAARAGRLASASTKGLQLELRQFAGQPPAARLVLPHSPPDRRAELSRLGRGRGLRNDANTWRFRAARAAPPSHPAAGKPSLLHAAFRRRSAAPNDHAWPRTLCATGTVGAATLAFNRAAEQPRRVNDGDRATRCYCGRCALMRR